MEKYNVGDILKLKKKHPCGSDTWEIVRYGADVKLKCTGCERIIMVPRVELYKNIIKKMD